MKDKSNLKIYNTATRSLEKFKPIEPGKVGVYVCGPTVYDDCHLGHARAMVSFDIIYRWLGYSGYNVRYVRNITDVDDKIIKRAEEKGVSCSELADLYIRRFHEDIGKLSMLEPAVEPRATEHIGDMLALISMLFEKGLAYEAGGDVYYDVEKFKNYGAFSGKRPDDLLAGARVEVNERKRSPLDFALWKSAKHGEPQWQSPWGSGRPGWHIECAAMSTKYLGSPFDIHGGGSDLIFPHHENEIAQHEGATGSRLARYWLHNAHVTVNETKMSKSLGNFFTLREIYARFDPRVVRFFLSRTHYRTPIDFSDNALSEAASAIGRIEECLVRSEEALGKEVEEGIECPREFASAMDDDFNTTEAVGVIFGLVSRINSELDDRDSGWAERVAGCTAAVKTCCGLLGVRPAERRARRVGESGEGVNRSDLERLLERESLAEGEIEELVKMRNALRKKSDFDMADRIREKIHRLGYEIRDDRKGGARIRKLRSSNR